MEMKKAKRNYIERKKIADFSRFKLQKNEMHTFDSTIHVNWMREKNFRNIICSLWRKVAKFNLLFFISPSIPLN